MPMATGLIPRMPTSMGQTASPCWSRTTLGNVESQVINVTVEAVADLSAADDAASVDEDGVLEASVADNDSTISGGALTYALAAGATTANGELLFNEDGSYTYTPNTDYYGPDSFSYVVTDAASGESSTQTVSLSVIGSRTVDLSVDTAELSEDQAGTLTYTVTLKDGAGNVVTVDSDIEIDVTLPDGRVEIVTIFAGSSSATTTYEVVANEDSIVEDIALLASASIAGDTGSEFLSVKTGTSQVSTAVTNSIDTTTVTVGDASVNEDAASATVAVTLEGHVFKANETVTVTLGDGTKVDFTENGSKDATYGFTADPDSIKDAGTAAITATVESSAGLIEDPSVTAGTLTISDVTDTTTVTVGDASVNEDAASATVAVTLEGHVFKANETVTVTLGDGTKVDFTENGSKDATYGFTADPDSIKDAGTAAITATVESSAGLIEDPSVTAGTLTISDVTDTTTVTVGDASVNEDAASATVAVTLEGHVFKANETVTVTLGDGTKVDFTENGSKDATYGFTADPDSIKDAGTAAITATVESSAGLIEDPSVTAGTLTISDVTDTTTVTVGDASVNEDAASATVAVTLEGHVFKANETVTVTLGDGTKVDFTENGSKDATYGFTADPDSIKDAGTAAITATVESSAGLIEDPSVTAGTLTISDVTDTTTVTVGDASVNEDAASATVAVTLEGHVFKANETVTVTLGDGTKVDFTENGSKDATYGFTADPDSIKDAGTAAITATVESSAGLIEDPSVTAGTLTISDVTDTTTVTVGDASVNEDAASATVAVTLEGHVFKANETVTVTLGDGTKVDFTENGSKDATYGFTADPDSIKDAGTAAITATVESSAGLIEDPSVTAGTLTISDVTDTTTVTLSDPTAAADGSVTVVATVDNAVQGSNLVITLNNGESITIYAEGTDLGDGTTADGLSGSVSFAVTESVSLSVLEVSSNTFEDLDLADTADITFVFDDAPVAINPEEVIIVNSGGSVTGALDIDNQVEDNFGNDVQGSSITFNYQDGQDSGFTSSGLPVYLYQSAGVMYGTTTLPVSGQSYDPSNDSNQVFSVSLAVTDGNDTFTFNLDQPLDLGGYETGVSSFSGGNSDWQIFLNTSEGSDQLFTAYGIADGDPTRS